MTPFQVFLCPILHVFHAYLPLAEPDILRFPIAVLTAAALVEGLTATLVAKYEYEADWHREVTRRRRPRRSHVGGGALMERRVARAEREVEGVLHDIQAALQLSDVSLGCFTIAELLKGRAQCRRGSVLAGNGLFVLTDDR